jgi:uncharacterized membrane protein
MNGPGDARAAARQRDETIDVLRGLAIFTMVAANMAAVVLVEPHPFALRAYGSFAAPLFIFLSGMMVAHTSRARSHPFSYFALRGVLVVLVGALLDVLLYSIYPFIEMDVLYLIGLGLAAAYLLLRCSRSAGLTISVLILLLTPILHATVGYRRLPTEIELFHGLQRQTVLDVVRNWFVDGYFPVFPWLGFSFLGALSHDIRRRFRPFSLRRHFRGLAVSGGVLVSGILVWRAFPGTLFTRWGYSELFYPPTIGYLLTALGVIALLFFIVDGIATKPLLAPLRVLGRTSLFMYILHLVVIDQVMERLWTNVSLRWFLVLYVATAGALILVAFGVRAVMDRWKRSPFLVRFVLGG